MLVELSIENFALVDRMTVEFGPGLCILTGETGAGKSIIVDAINALLGERVSVDVVRQGSDRAAAAGAFLVSSSPETLQALHQQGFDAEDGLLLVSREISSSGKTQARINGRLVTLTQLKEVTRLLADVHGQHEHQLLFDERWQAEFLDTIAGPELEKLLNQYRDIWRYLQSVRRELAELTSDIRERARLLDLYRFQVQEIERADLRVGEEEELAAENLRLANLEKLFLAAAGVRELLSGGDAGQGAAEQLAEAVKQLEIARKYDPAASQWADTLAEAQVIVHEVADSVRQWAATLEVSPERIDEVQSRLDLISSLKRKYGDSIGEILEYNREIATKLESLQFSDERRGQLEEEVLEAEKRCAILADSLSKAREQAARRVEGMVESELRDLALPGARFTVDIQAVPPGPTGADAIRFLFSANPGEDPRPLSRIASGGEASRAMLALKTVMAGADPVTTLVFDEIDSGIGGVTANAVSGKLKQLSQNKQILVVTHLTQIARAADHHFRVEKRSRDGRTVVSLVKLGQEERVGELARMLGGGEESEAAVKHARELLGLGAREDG